MTLAVKLWTIDEYHRMIATGILRPDDRVELLEGQIVAKAGITDYWILDVNDRRMYVLQAPTAEGYQQEDVFDSGSVLALLAFPAVEVLLHQLFP